MGAIDSIIDTVGVVYALYLLGIEKVYCSALPFSEVGVDVFHTVHRTPCKCLNLALLSLYVDVMAYEGTL